jgi:hypothetical protein
MVVERAALCGQALSAALAQAEPDDLICVTGSLSLAGEALRWLAAYGGPEAAAAIQIASVDE